MLKESAILFCIPVTRY